MGLLERSGLLVGQSIRFYEAACAASPADTVLVRPCLLADGYCYAVSAHSGCAGSIGH